MTGDILQLRSTGTSCLHICLCTGRW